MGQGSGLASPRGRKRKVPAAGHWLEAYEDSVITKLILPTRLLVAHQISPVPFVLPAMAAISHKPLALPQA